MAGPSCSRRTRVSADIWSVTSFNELRRDGTNARWNLLHPEAAAQGLLERCCGPHRSDHRSDPIHEGVRRPIRAYLPSRRIQRARHDGFGRSDRAALRGHSSGPRYVAVAALKAPRPEALPQKKVVEAIRSTGGSKSRILQGLRSVRSGCEGEAGSMVWCYLPNATTHRANSGHLNIRGDG